MSKVRDIRLKRINKIRKDVIELNEIIDLATGLIESHTEIIYQAKLKRKRLQLESLNLLRQYEAEKCKSTK